MKKLAPINYLMILSLSLFLTSKGLAFSPIKTGHKKLSTYIKEGVFVGGKANGEFSLLNVRHQFIKSKKLERLILDVGDGKGQPLLNKINYYHISYQGNKVRIHLPRLAKYSMSLAGLEKKLSTAKFIESALVLTNPKEGSTSLILEVKPGVQLEAFSLPSSKKAGRIILDMVGL